MGGLNAQSAGSTTLAAGGPAPGSQFVALDADHPGADAGSYASESHLDSFFAGSGWTREDVQLIMSVASTLLLLYWLYLEVQ